MLMTNIDYTEKLKTTLVSQDNLLSEICDIQKKIRESVNDRNWDELQYHLLSFDALSKNFADLEEERVVCFNNLGLKDGTLLNSLKDKFTEKESADIYSLYNSIKQKLVASKIENKALNDYIKITTDFLQGVFDNVVPQRKATVYSRTGALVKNQPKSMILNTVL